MENMERTSLLRKGENSDRSLFEKHVEAFTRDELIKFSKHLARDLEIIKDSYAYGLADEENAKKHKTKTTTVETITLNFYSYAVCREQTAYTLRKYCDFNSKDEARVIELIDPPAIVAKVLYRYVTTLDELTCLTEEEFTSLDGAGNWILDYVRDMLIAEGLSFKEPSPKVEVFTPETKIMDLPIDPIDKIYINRFGLYSLRDPFENTSVPRFPADFTSIVKKIETLADLYYVDISELHITKRKTKYDLMYAMTKAKLGRVQFSQVIKPYSILKKTNSLLRHSSISCLKREILRLSDVYNVLKYNNIDIDRLEKLYVLCDFNGKQNIPSQYVPSTLVEEDCFVLSAYVTSTNITYYLISKDQIKRFYSCEMSHEELYDAYIDLYTEKIAKSKNKERDLEILRLKFKSTRPCYFFNNDIAKKLSVSSSIVRRVVNDFLQWARRKEKLALTED